MSCDQWVAQHQPARAARGEPPTEAEAYEEGRYFGSGRGDGADAWPVPVIQAWCDGWHARFLANNARLPQEARRAKE